MDKNVCHSDKYMSAKTLISLYVENTTKHP